LKIIITGSIAFDTLMQFPGKFSEHFIPDKIETISVSFLVDTMQKQRGGCGPNIAYSLALLGAKPLLVATAGKDFSEYRGILNGAGVDTSGVREIADVYTASFFANTDRDGSQICSFYTGAMRFAKEHSLKPFLADAGRDALVIVSPNDPAAMIRYTRECRESGTRFIFDPGQQIARLSGDELASGARGAAVLIMNEYEFEMMKKKTGMDDASLFSLAETVIVTMSGKGAEIRARGGIFRIPAALPKTVSDPTGVGDAFRSGLLMGMSLGFSWETAGRMGSLAAVYVLETDGPQNHHYTVQEFVLRYKENFGESEEIERLVS
jgi:adenosine kinase